MRVFGVENYAELLRTAANYTLDGVADQIVAPTLIMEGEHDTLLQGQPERVERALTAAKATFALKVGVWFRRVRFVI